MVDFGFAFRKWDEDCRASEQENQSVKFVVTLLATLFTECPEIGCNEIHRNEDHWNENHWNKEHRNAIVWKMMLQIRLGALRSRLFWAVSAERKVATFPKLIGEFWPLSLRGCYRFAIRIVWLDPNDGDPGDHEVILWRYPMRYHSIERCDRIYSTLIIGEHMPELNKTKQKSLKWVCRSMDINGYPVDIFYLILFSW